MNPTAEWCLQQIRNILMDYDILPKYLIRDRDIKYGKLLGDKKNKFGVDEIITTYRCPWQNGYVERAIGSIRGKRNGSQDNSVLKGRSKHWTEQNGRMSSVFQLKLSSRWLILIQF